MPPLAVAFVGGTVGEWHVERLDRVSGASLPLVPRLAVTEGSTPPAPAESGWVLRGAASNERYVERSEREALDARQPRLGRPEATRAALIPITKTTSWWELPQGERRKIFEDSAHHIAVGLEYLPAVARRLHHGRDLGEAFDFLTWFEYAPADGGRFEELLARLRETEEWTYVEREVDIRLAR